MFTFRKKYQPPKKNKYDITLSTMLDNIYAQSIISDLKRYARAIHLKQKSLSVYPEGQDRDLALCRIKSNQQCLQTAIKEYDEWHDKVTHYIVDNVNQFEYYSGYKTGERMLPPASYEIIDNAVFRLNS